MKKSVIADIGLSTLAGLIPVPGIGLLLNRRVLRRVRKLGGVALVGAGVAVAVPVALYVICKTSPGAPAQKN